MNHAIGRDPHRNLFVAVAKSLCDRPCLAPVDILGALIARKRSYRPFTGRQLPPRDGYLAVIIPIRGVLPAVMRPQRARAEVPVRTFRHDVFRHAVGAERSHSKQRLVGQRSLAVAVGSVRMKPRNTDYQQ